MPENNTKISPQIDINPPATLAGGSPKSLYVFFLLGLAKNYFECMRCGPDELDIDSATASLIAFCPNRGKREELWRLYVKQRDEPGSTHLTASVYCVGEFISYLSETLEFEESSTGGLM